ncbi:hypothetical protein ACFL6Y_10750, partial [Elusimicrobiota bacterium]
NVEVQDTFLTGTSEIVIATQTINTSTKTYFILYDVSAQATAGKRFGTGLAAGSYLTVNSPNDVDSSVFPIESSSTTINSTVADLFIERKQDFAPPYAVQGTTNVVFARLTLQTTAYSLNLEGFTIKKLGTLDDEYISNIRVYLDEGDEAVGAGDTQLTSGERLFISSEATILFSESLLIEKDPVEKYLLITLDFPLDAPVGETIGIEISSASDFRVNSPNSVSSTTADGTLMFPINNAIPSQIYDSTDTLFLALEDVAGVEIGQGYSDEPIIKISAYADNDEISWTRVRFEKSGSLSDVYLDYLKLYRDDGDGEWEGTGIESLVSTATFTADRADIEMSETVRNSTSTYFVCIDVSSNAIVADNFAMNFVGESYVTVADPDIAASISAFNTKEIEIRDVRTPTVPIVVDEGRFTKFLTHLAASWTSRVDVGTITAFEYAVGTTMEGTDAKDWTNNSTDSRVDIVGLSLTIGSTYYISVRAHSSLGYTSIVGCSDGILVDIVKPEFDGAPGYQLEEQNLVITWTKPPVTGVSGITKYRLEERRADKPTWSTIVEISTSGTTVYASQSMTLSAQSMGASSELPLRSIASPFEGEVGRSPGEGYKGFRLFPSAFRALAVSSESITADTLQVALIDKPSGTYFYRVKAMSGSGQWSDASNEIRVVVGMPAGGVGLANVMAYPNPCDVRTRAVNIYYDIGVDSDVEVKIYDLFGQHVKTTNFSSGGEGGRSGANTVTWDGKNFDGDYVSFGVYLMRVTHKSSGMKKVYKLGIIH